MKIRSCAAAGLLGLVSLVATGCGGTNSAAPSSANPNGANAPAAGQAVELLNVSYDPTRELYSAINEQFAAHYQQETGQQVTVRQSHGASGSQARAIIDGLEADVATLSIESDTNAIVKSGLIQPGWQERLPNRSLPYNSTVVFVVRKGNPKNIRDWPDLVAGDLEVITPNPKTSGNGKLSFLAAWGSVVLNGGSEEAAREFVTQLYQRVPVLDTGARGATTTFAQKEIGDVHLTMEHEAYLEVAEAGDALEIVYPSLSILHQPYVAVVDANVDRKGTRAVAEAYLKFLYTPAAQEILARLHYRPTDPAVAAAHADDLPAIKLFAIADIVADWDAAQEKFFRDGAIFDSIYVPADAAAQQ